MVTPHPHMTPSAEIGMARLGMRLAPVRGEGLLQVSSLWSACSFITPPFPQPAAHFFLSILHHRPLRCNRYDRFPQLCSRCRRRRGAVGWHHCSVVSLSRRILAYEILSLADIHCAFPASFSLSSQCQDTLAALVTSSDASCLNAQALVGLIASSSSSANTSIVSPINTWATGLCSRAACSNDTLATVVSNVTSGCSSDLESLGLSNIDSGELTQLVQTAYPSVRQILCLAE